MGGRRHRRHCRQDVTSCSLCTSPIPYGTRTFQIDFDFIAHQVIVQSSDGGVRRPSAATSIGGGLLPPSDGGDGQARSARSTSTRDRMRCPIRFRSTRTTLTARTIGSTPTDSGERSCEADRVFKAFRARFIGKCSPVHFFWGAPDLAVTRFSGRRAPEHPGGVPNLPDWVTREAYSHEVSSCGVLAGWRFGSVCGVLLVRVSRADGLLRRRKSTGRGVLQRRASGIRAAVRRSPGVRVSRRHPARFPPDDVRGSSERGKWDRSSLERHADPRRGV